MKTLIYTLLALGCYLLLKEWMTDFVDQLMAQLNAATALRF